MAPRGATRPRGAGRGADLRAIARLPIVHGVVGLGGFARSREAVFLGGSDPVADTDPGEERDRREEDVAESRGAGHGWHPSEVALASPVVPITTGSRRRFETWHLCETRE